MTDRKKQPLALIVEDDSLLADVYSRTLNLVAYQTKIVGDGQEALEWLSRQTPDLLILDLHLPSVSGDVILRRVKREPRLNNMQIMILTADSTMMAQMDLTGRTIYTLVKPVNPIQLQKLAERLKET